MAPSRGLILHLYAYSHIRFLASTGRTMHPQPVIVRAEARLQELDREIFAPKFWDRERVRVQLGVVRGSSLAVDHGRNGDGYGWDTNTDFGCTDSADAHPRPSSRT